MKKRQTSKLHLRKRTKLSNSNCLSTNEMNRQDKPKGLSNMAMSFYRSVEIMFLCGALLLRARSDAFLIQSLGQVKVSALCSFSSCSLVSTRCLGKKDDEDYSPQIELVEEEDDYERDEDWTPDREKSKQRRLQARVYAESVRQQQEAPRSAPAKITPDKLREDDSTRPKASPYTEEEEDVIAAMGGKTSNPSRKREQGFLGDSTLNEIATDYGVPVCYLADVLCMWGVPVPIQVHDRLGDLVTGEQAFSILEAINSLDISALHDRYSNHNLIQLCAEYDIELQTAFEMAMKEGWSLPFGVNTCLRVEQSDELVRVHGPFD
jgi:hypothetical protein